MCYNKEKEKKVIISWSKYIHKINTLWVTLDVIMHDTWNEPLATGCSGFFKAVQKTVHRKLVCMWPMVMEHIDTLYNYNSNYKSMQPAALCIYNVVKQCKVHEDVWKPIHMDDWLYAAIMKNNRIIL